MKDRGRCNGSLTSKTYHIFGFQPDRSYAVSCFLQAWLMKQNIFLWTISLTKVEMGAIVEEDVHYALTLQKKHSADYDPILSNGRNNAFRARFKFKRLLQGKRILYFA